MKKQPTDLQIRYDATRIRCLNLRRWLDEAQETLRDEFAKAALPVAAKHYGIGSSAKQAYRLADEMMAARKRP